MFDKPSEEIKQRLNIVEIIQEYTPLKKSGANWKALCPFHSEKTPSFMVSEDKQIFKCFGCFPKGSLIKTENGFEPIEKIKIGQNVLTHKGRFERVIRLLKRQYKGVMIDIKTRKSNQTISLTSDHKVYVIKTNSCKQKSRKTRICQFRCKQNCSDKYFKNYKVEKISADKLRKNDYLLYPVNEKTTDIKRIKLTDYLTKQKPKRSKEIRQLPKFIKVDSDFLKLLGYWIAGGSNHRAYIRFSLGSHEENFAEEIVKLIKKIFNLEASRHKRSKSEKTGIEVTCCNSNLSNIFENLCGKGVENKHIPYEFLNLPLKKQKIILETILKGGGYKGLVNKGKTKKEYKAITVISSVLVEQLKDILLRIGYTPTLMVQREKIDKSGVKHRKAYTLNWQENKIAHYSDFYINEGVKYWLIPIKEIKKRNFTGNVYNLTVNKDHSYTTANFTVGNCGEGGDVFSFVMKIEGIEFLDALRLLAKKAGVVLKRQDAKLQTKRSKLLEILDLASKFYHKALLESKSGKIARDYLKERKVEDITQDEFRLGFAPDSWDALSLFLKRKGFHDDEILESGLVVRKESSNPNSQFSMSNYYDRFRNRLIFPIFDVHGAVIGFGGRVLPQISENSKSSESAGAKYINTPQTLIYDKSRVLYGLDKAKTEIRKNKLAVIVEGYMDVIASHQAGIKNVVASSGTALTPFQIELIKRYTENVVLAFDMDVAGDSATKRGIDQAVEAGLNVKILQLPEGKDPDECIKKDKKIWIESIARASSIMDYYFENIFLNLDPTKVEGKKEIAKVLLPQIKIIPNKIEQAHYLQRLAQKLKVDEKILAEVMAGQKTKESSKKSKRDESTLIKKDENEILGERFFGLILSYPRFLDYFTKDFDLQYLPRKFAPLYTKLIDYYNKEKENFELSDFLQKLNSEDQKLAFQAKEFLLCFEKDQEEKSLKIQNSDSPKFRTQKYFLNNRFDPEKELKIIVSRLKNAFLKKRMRAINEEMQVAEKAHEDEKIKNLVQEFNQLSQKLNE